MNKQCVKRVTDSRERPATRNVALTVKVRTDQLYAGSIPAVQTRGNHIHRPEQVRTDDPGMLNGASV